MWKRKKERIPSKNYCIICGRNTNDKKFPTENWGNQFFSCQICKKVWCASCMGQVKGRGPSKIFNQGKKGKVNCPDCGNFAAMVKLPTNLPFSQSQKVISTNSEGYAKKKICQFCHESIPKNSTFCNICGVKQD
ncbi:hypothetical protein LCGC14_2437640 [marine sediment metagenome]|uniref:Uncharacterized protein n=1 Tax=marine sediment metagenome TaxID=412755 RepID=A0A0F9BK12_9ZZZZ